MEPKSTLKTTRVAQELKKCYCGRSPLFSIIHVHYSNGDDKFWEIECEYCSKSVTSGKSIDKVIFMWEEIAETWLGYTNKDQFKQDILDERFNND